MQKWIAGLAAWLVATLAAGGDNVWTSVGPEGGLIRQVVVAPSAPSTLYAVGHGGAWKSVDGGAHWIAVRTGIDELTLQAVAVDPTNAQVVYAASILGGGVFKSVDGGTSWTEVTSGVGISQFRSLAIDPANPATVYAGTPCCGIYKSTNAGTSWVKLEGGLPSTSVWAIVVDPAAPATVYAGTQSQGVYKSTNGGGTWTAVNAGLANSNGSFNQLFALAIDPAATGTLYAATGGAIFKTVNGGATWAPSNGTLNNPLAVSVAVNPQVPSTVYVGVSGGVRRSTDGGATWVLANAGAPSTVGSLAIDSSNPARIYGGTDAGIFVTANGGTSWAASNVGLNNSTVQALVVDPSNPSTVYAGTAGSGVQKSADGGATWNASNTGMPTSAGARDIRALAIDPGNPAIVYAGNGAGIFKSTNGGASWTSIEHGTLIRNISSIAIDWQSPSTVRVGTFFTGVFVSRNGGDTWAQENEGLPGTPSVNALAAGGGAVIASTPQNGSFVRSPSTWIALSGLEAQTQLASIGVVGTSGAGAVGPMGALQSVTTIGGTLKVNVANPFEVIYAAEVVVMADPAPKLQAKEQNVWSPLPLAMGVDSAQCPPVKVIVGDPVPGSFYAGAACGVLAGTNHGQSITAMNNGMPAGLQVAALAVTPSGNDIYAGTEGGGVFRYTKSGAATAVTVVEYYNQSLDHYFITWLPAEQANLDAGNTPTRWTRTGYSFKAYTTPQAGASPVCRYYIPPNLGDSHFFGRGTQECNATGQNNPSFTLESADFMQMFLPSAGTCPAGTVNVYRVFSNRPDANHRYLIDQGLRAEMAAKGWLIEGDGPDAVVMCAPI